MGETNRRFTTTTTLYNYIPIPRSTLKLGLPTTALIIYGLLCDRATLSRKNGYYSADGWIYAVYPVLELTEIMGMGPTAIKKNLRTLENAGLIVRIRHSRKEANRFISWRLLTAFRTPGGTLLLPDEDGKVSCGGTQNRPLVT